MKITFKLKGKTVTPDDIGEGTQLHLLLQGLQELIEYHVGDMYCLEHGRQLTEVICRGGTGNDFFFEFSGCCNDFEEEITEKIKALDGEVYSPKNFELVGAEARKFNVRLFCRICGRDTYHVLQYGQAYELMALEGLPYRFFWNVWLIWKCNNCSHLLLHDTEKAPQWFDGVLWDGDLETGSVTLYPAEPETDPNDLKVREFYHVPKELNHVYREIISSFNNRNEILCTIGIRALVEEICDANGLTGNLSQKIEKLTTLGVPISLTESLDGMKELGNKATHELAFAKREDLQLAIEIVESILDLIYELEPKTKQLKEHRKTRESKK